MPDHKPKTLNDARLKKRALNRWENEGGATASGHEEPVTKTLPSHVTAQKKIAVLKIG